MNKKRKIYFTTLLLSILFGIYIFVTKGFNYSYDGKSILWKYITLWDHGTEGIFLIVVMTLCMIGVVMEKYKEYFYHFDKNCIIRISVKKYIINNIKNIFFDTTVFMFLLHISLLCFDLLYFNDPFLDTVTNYCYFTNNQLMNISIFIILSCIGMSILNIFIYSLSIYINNLYLYIVLPIILLFTTLILGDTLVQIFSIFFDYDLTRTICLSIIPASLVQPGSLINFALPSYICSFLLYSFLSVINIIYTIKRKEL